MRRKSVRFNSSVAIVALVTVVILLIIAMGLIQIVLFTSLNSERSSDIIRAKWFLEGRVEEFIDGIVTGTKQFSLGKFVYKEPIDGADQIYEIDVAKEADRYVLTATMRWKEKYPVQQRIEFMRLNPFEYTLFFNSDESQKVRENMVVFGNIAARGYLELSEDGGGKIYYNVTPAYKPRVDYWGSTPSLSPFFFTNAINGLIAKPFIDFNPSPYNLEMSEIVKRNQSLRELKLPDFMTLMESFLHYRDDRWVLKDYGAYETLDIANYLNSEKELVAFGDGFTTRFPVSAGKVMYVYIKRIANNLRYQKVDTFDYAYYYGIQNRDQFYRYDGTVLYLTASENPFAVMLDEDAYRTFGQFYLSGANWSYASSDERVNDVYFDSAVSGSRLLDGVDYSYDRYRKAIKIMAEEFYKRHTWSLGTGDGSKTLFDFANPGGRIYIYVGNARTTSFTTYGNTINFDYSIPYGIPVNVMQDPPSLYIRKAPPPSGTGVFVDSVDRALVLDLSAIQNFPEHGVIISMVPLLIKGTPREPLAIIGWDDIYIESVNPTEGGKEMGAPVFIASRTGVWIYRRTSQFMNEINRCVIDTPLNTIDTVFESGEIGNPPVTIYGSVFFTGESPSREMNMNFFAKNFIYCADILKYLDREPFSLFPLPVIVNVVRRS